MIKKYHSRPVHMLEGLLILNLTLDSLFNNNSKEWGKIGLKIQEGGVPFVPSPGPNREMLNNNF